jgi:uncharacterized protein YhhL (DUF1145 family)
VAEERSVSDVLQDILRNLQDMVRFEIRLAKTEIREEVREAVTSGIWIAAGTVGAVSAWIFLLWTLAYALATRMPMWAATLVIAVVMIAVATILLMGGVQRARRIQPMPERTVESVKESLEWIKQSTK